jgi:5'-methylthioadenosine phosphorylase
MPRERSCGCGDALKHAILTDRKAIPAATRKKLAILLDKYLQ